MRDLGRQSPRLVQERTVSVPGIRYLSVGIRALGSRTMRAHVPASPLQFPLNLPESIFLYRQSAKRSSAQGSVHASLYRRGISSPQTEVAGQWVTNCANHELGPERRPGEVAISANWHRVV